MSTEPRARLGPYEISAQIGAPRVVAQEVFGAALGMRTPFAVTPDGGAVVIQSRLAGASPVIDVALNWTQELKARVPRP